MATALYARVSTGRQEKNGVSLETQQERILAYCKLNDLKNIKEYIDVGSARNTSRVNYQRMMEDVENGLISNVVIYKLNRLNRSNLDLLKMVEHLKKYNCGFHSTTDNIDTSSANGKLQLNMFGAMAEHESNLKSEVVSDNMMTLASQGVWMGATPYGFYLGEDRRLKIKEDEASILREAFNLMLEGESMMSAERIIHKKYNTGWSYNFLRRKVRQASTVGDMEWNGEIYENTHPGIITKEEQAKIIDILINNRSGRRGTVRNDIFRRRIVCYQCDYIMLLNTRSNNNYKSVIYNYVCGNCNKKERGSVSVTEGIMEQALLNYLRELKLEGFPEKEKSDDEKLVSKLNGRLKSIGRQRDKIQRAWITNMMSEEDLQKYKKELDEEEESINHELSKITTFKPLSVDKLRELKAFFATLFEELTRDEKRAFVQRHIKRIYFNRELVKGYQKKYNVTVSSVDFF